MLSRRSLLGALLGAAAAPAIVRAESLMKIVVPRREIILPGTATFTASAGAGDNRVFSCQLWGGRCQWKEIGKGQRLVLPARRVGDPEPIILFAVTSLA